MVVSNFNQPLWMLTQSMCSGEWVTFTGDQLGTLFAARALDIYKSSNKPLSETSYTQTLVISSGNTMDKICRQIGDCCVHCKFEND